MSGRLEHVHIACTPSLASPTRAGSLSAIHDSIVPKVPTHYSRPLASNGIVIHSAPKPILPLTTRALHPALRTPHPDHTRAPYEMPNDILKITRRTMKSPFDRLHESQTHTIHKRDIQTGLVPDHILKNEPPAAGHIIKSTDFFPANKFDRPKTSPSPLCYAHSMAVTTSPTKAQLQVSSRPLTQRPTDPVTPFNLPTAPTLDHYTILELPAWPVALGPAPHRKPPVRAHGSVPVSVCVSRP